MVYFVTSARPNPILIHWSFPWPCGNIKYCEVTSCCDEGITSRYHRADFPVARVCFLAHLILLFFISLYFPWRFNIGCFDIFNIIHHVILMFWSHCCRNLFYFCHHSHIYTKSNSCRLVMTPQIFVCCLWKMNRYFTGQYISLCQHVNVWVYEMVFMKFSNLPVWT
jgi:hypothetical protein